LDGKLLISILPPCFQHPRTVGEGVIVAGSTGVGATVGVSEGGIEASGASVAVLAGEGLAGTIWVEWLRANPAGDGVGSGIEPGAIQT